MSLSYYFASNQINTIFAEINLHIYCLLLIIILSISGVLSSCKCGLSVIKDRSIKSRSSQTTQTSSNVISASLTVTCTTVQHVWLCIVIVHIQVNSRVVTTMLVANQRWETLVVGSRRWHWPNHVRPNRYGYMEGLFCRHHLCVSDRLLIYCIV